MSGTASRQHLFEIFGYTTASISNWVWTYKNEKHLVQRSSRHRKAIFNGADLKRFSELPEKSVSLTLAEIKEHFGVQCSLVAIHKTLTKLGFVFKKC